MYDSGNICVPDCQTTRMTRFLEDSVYCSGIRNYDRYQKQVENRRKQFDVYKPYQFVPQMASPPRRRRRYEAWEIPTIPSHDSDGHAKPTKKALLKRLDKAEDRIDQLVDLVSKVSAKDSKSSTKEQKADEVRAAESATISPFSLPSIPSPLAQTTGSTLRDAMYLATFLFINHLNVVQNS